MSSLSGAQYEADFPPSADAAASQRLTPSDQDLVRRAQAGDRGAYGELAVRYQDRLFNAILRMIGDREEARELTQEAFTRGLSKLASFRGEASPYTWLFRIAVNLTISQLRKVQRHRTFSLEASNGRARGEGVDQAVNLIDRMGRKPAPLPAEQLEIKERSQQVLTALGKLDAEYRAVLVMRDIEGFDYEQMAQILNLPLGTLKSRLFRARLALRDQLKQYFK